MGQTKKPYANLGLHLKAVREQAKRSLAEVSGAVEIEEKELTLIEAGQLRPEEDVMLLLINYFNMADQEALHLWELAQYDSELSEHLIFEAAGAEDTNLGQLISKPMVMLLGMDVRTMYSDSFDINWNEAGLTISFNQSSDSKDKQKLTISKVGMSFDQAYKVMQGIELALLRAKYLGSTKLLPPNFK